MTGDHAAAAATNMIFAHARNERPFAMALIVSFIVHGGAMMVSLPVATLAPLATPIPLEVQLRAREEPFITEAAASRPPIAAASKPKSGLSEVSKMTVVEPASPLPLPGPAIRESALAVATIAPDPAPRVEIPVEPPAPPSRVAKVTLPGALPRELVESYGAILSQALGRYKEYPRTAQIRGWEGSVTMRLRVAATGRLIDAVLHTSSGYEVLDRQALAMAHRPELLPPPPISLRDGEISVLVPVVFRLGRE